MQYRLRNAEQLQRVFGYLSGRRGAACNLRDAGHGLQGAGCEMLSLF